MNSSAVFVRKGFAMANCAKCSLPLDENAKFCASCGAAVSVGQPVAASGTAASPTPQVTQVMVVEPKRGGKLALKGFILAFVLSVIFVASTTSSHRESLTATSMFVAFGVGAAYIITNLRRWKKKNEVVTGGGVGWAVAIVLLVFCVASLSGISSHENSVASPASQASPTAVGSNNAESSAAQKRQEPLDQDKELQLHLNDAKWLDDHYEITAGVACKEPVEKLAKYNFEWFDTWSEQKFDSYYSPVRAPGILVVTGDKIKFQNGFGAWQIMKYECAYDVVNNVVANASAEPR